MKNNSVIQGILQKVGFGGVESTALDGLYYVCCSILEELVQGTAAWSQWAGRLHAHSIDIYNLCRLLHIPISELKQMVSENRILYPRISTEVQEIESGSPELNVPIIRFPLNEDEFSSEIYGDGLPPLPSIHTYKYTPVFVKRNLVASKVIIQTSVEKRKLERNLRRLLLASRGGPKSVFYED